MTLSASQDDELWVVNYEKLGMLSNKVSRAAYSLISISTPAGSSRDMSASTVF